MALDYTKGCVNFRDVGEWINEIAGYRILSPGRILRGGKLDFVRSPTEIGRPETIISVRSSFSPSFSYQSKGVPYFLARALPDTVLAGPGTVNYSLGTGHFGAAGNPEIYGQRFAVERYGSFVPALNGHPQVVVVPWDYGASCETLPWTRSARWAGDDELRFIKAVLREPAHWVDGVPTLDAFTPQCHYYFGATCMLYQHDLTPS